MAAERLTDNKIILVTQKTRLEQLVVRYNTIGQAQFFIEHSGGDFGDYQREHDTYTAAAEKAVEILSRFGRVQRVDREFVPRMIFGKTDTVITLGRDGLAANVLKYLDGLRLIGVNPDPARWDGVLLPFTVNDLAKLMPEVMKGTRRTQSVTLAECALSDGQSLCAVNDLFIGRRTHVSAQYEIDLGGRRERQSSSGVIVSTGLGSTGWFRSVIAGAEGVARGLGAGVQTELERGFGRDADYLYYTVREPFPSKTTGTDIVFGRIERGVPMRITSMMPENGVIFSDGVEDDSLVFNSGTTAEINVSDRRGILVV